jgi:SAM-dependent methyltransferase
MVRSSADAVEFYHRSATAFAPSYESVSFDDVHGALLRHLPAAAACVLDVGAGTGRDARALALLGHFVVAVEPAAAFRALGGETDDRIEWLDDRLPALSKVKASGRTFAFILCSAVLMSVPTRDLPACFASMAALLRHAGRLAISIRDPAPDDEPLVLHGHSDESILAASEAAGLTLLERKVIDDALGRPIAWRSFVFVRPDGAGITPAGPARRRRGK